MKYFFILLFCCCGLLLSAQPPQLFKYQGLAREADGNPVAGDTISLRISIHQSTPAGTVVYQETHRPATNEFGSFSISIGGGTVVSGNFSTIPWGRNVFFQEVEMDVTGGTTYVSMGTSQYLSIPYALATDSSKAGIAPFIVKNDLNAADTSGVAVVALSNADAPTIYSKNLGTGVSLLVDGTSSFEDEVQVNGNVEINGGTLKVNGAVINSGFSNFQVFNSSGTFTVPAGITRIMVELWGAGGGGGGGGGSTSSSTMGGSGGGAGAGGYVKDILSVTPGASITVTIGIGGAGGQGGQWFNLNHDGLPGANGGNTSFGTTTVGSGNGGNPGTQGTGSGNGNGGSGGAGGNAPGLLGITGQFGFDANYSGFGGSSPNGGFGGNPGGNKTPGGGGSGGIGQSGGINSNGHDGTSGGDGRIIVWW